VVELNKKNLLWSILKLFTELSKWYLVVILWLRLAQHGVIEWVDADAVRSAVLSSLSRWQCGLCGGEMAEWSF
jgi:hypothetical protein